MNNLRGHGNQTATDHVHMAARISELQQQIATLQAIGFHIMPTEECADRVMGGGDPMTDMAAAMLLDPNSERFSKAMQLWHRRLVEGAYDE